MVDYSTSTLLSPTMIVREALRLLKNNLVMGNLVYRAYETEFPGFPKKGGTVQIRKPVKFKTTKARTRATSTVSEDKVTLTVATQANISWAFIMSDLTLSIEEYSERYIRPAAAALANTVDSDLCALYDDLWNSVQESTGVITPSTFMVFGKAMQRLDEEAAPPEDRVVVFNPAAHWSMANALSALYVPAVAEKAIRKGFIGEIAGCQVYMDQNIKTHTTGAWHTGVSGADGTGILVGTTGVPTAGSLVATMIPMIQVDITSIAAFKTGDVFTIANVYAVNPMSGESTGALRQFVVTASAYASCNTLTGYMDVYVQPDLIETGAYKTIDTMPLAGAVVNPMGGMMSKIPQNLAFHRNCFALVMVPLEKPDGQWGSSITEDGYSIRIVKDYNIDEDLEVIRLDILYGMKTIYPELGVRIYGQQIPSG